MLKILVLLLFIPLIMLFLNKSRSSKIISDRAFLVDVRTAKEFSKGSHEKAVNIPLDDIAKHLDKFKDKDEVVLFCRTGMRSRKAKQILEQHGIQNVRSLNVGYRKIQI